MRYFFFEEPLLLEPLFDELLLLFEPELPLFDPPDFEAALAMLGLLPARFNRRTEARFLCPAVDYLVPLLLLLEPPLPPLPPLPPPPRPPRAPSWPPLSATPPGLPPADF